MVERTVYLDSVNLDEFTLVEIDGEEYTKIGHSKSFAHVDGGVKEYKENIDIYLKNNDKAKIQFHHSDDGIPNMVLLRMYAKINNKMTLSEFIGDYVEDVQTNHVPHLNHDIFLKMRKKIYDAVQSQYPEHFI